VTNLGALLADEIERRISVFAGDTEPERVRAALHALRGAAALAGQHDLALILGQFGARLRQAEPDVAAEARALLARAAERLRAGSPAFPTHWPEPPEGLRAASVDLRYRTEYLATMRQRLLELEGILGSISDPSMMLDQAYRTVHAMKGAAGSVGDDATAWYCHGLETWLKSADAVTGSLRSELERQRMIVQLFVEEPQQALAHLRGEETPLGPLRDSSRPEGKTKSVRPSRPPAADEQVNADELLLHIRGSVIDRFVERVERIERVHGELAGVADLARQVAARLREMRQSLHGALRLIGPPRPWGAPAAALQQIEITARSLGATAEDAERGAQSCRRNAEVVRGRASEMRADLSALRRTSLGWLFERVANAVERLASSGERLVEIRISGGDLPIDRRVAERLLDPVMQLARNAIAHGIETPEQRIAAGKPAVGRLLLEAQRIGDWLRISVEDDGRGADVTRIRELASAEGGMPGAPDEDLLALLFTPGLTTQRGADLLAGRGVGLDLARDAVRRLGGAIRLSSRPGRGLTATIEVPSERGVMDVLWVRAVGHEFALPVSFTGRVHQVLPAGPVPALAGCLGLAQRHAPGLAVELSIHGVQSISIGIDGVGEVEETNIRPIPRVVAAIGPYSGAILRGDGSLCLALDAALLAARAWALTAAPRL
jgi:two-component system, chemotaxis family, sensor kinase CheA